MSAPDPKRRAVHTGGCQCGAVRFALTAEPRRVGLCHCRMCQKAVAGPFAALAEVRSAQFAWTKAEPATFRSSSRAVRDFCPACGTPLSYRQDGGDIIELLTGAFDAPARVPPTYATGTESILAWVGSLGQLPGRSTEQAVGTDQLAGLQIFQHADAPDDDERG